MLQVFWPVRRREREAMKPTNRNSSHFIAFGAAIALISVGIAKSHSHAHSKPPAADGPAKAAPADHPPTQPMVSRLRPEARRAAVSAARVPVPPATKPVREARGLPQPTRPPRGIISAPRPTGPTPVVARRKVGSRGPLPPLLPPLYGPELAASTPIPPPPEVLKLSGVVGGEHKLAVLRRGDSRFMARQGDTIAGGYHVLKITAQSVTLQRGGHRRTLRLGSS